MLKEFKEYSKSVQGGDQVPDDNQEPVVEPVVEPIVEPAQFSLTNEQLRGELRIALSSEKFKDDWGYESRRYWYLDSDDANVYAYDGGDHDRLASFAYTVIGDKVEIDFTSRQRVKIQYVPMEDGATSDVNIMPSDMMDYQVENKVKEAEKQFTEEKDALNAQIEQANTAYTTLEQETNQLREYAQQKQTEERINEENGLFEKFAAQLSDDDMADIRANVSKMSIAELENSLFIAVGKKMAKFTAQPRENKPLKINLGNEPKEVKPYGGLVERFVNK
jgi:hypothetical protein